MQRPPGVKKLSSHFNVSPAKFAEAKIFDAFIEFDTKLFVDPQLVKQSRIPEFKSAEEKIRKHFSEILILLQSSKALGDLAWRQARRRLTFREIRGLSIGYGEGSNHGNGVGPVLAGKLIITAKEIIDLGVAQPEIFELIGLFEEDFGADRLSDMTVAILSNEFLRFSARMIVELGIKPSGNILIDGKSYPYVAHPESRKPTIFIPEAFLRALPVALSWDEIEYVVATNQELRNRINQLIGREWKDGVLQKKKVTKRDIKRKLLADKKLIGELVDIYKKTKPTSYDFKDDPAGQTTWQAAGEKIAKDFPLQLNLITKPSLEDIEKVVDAIIAQFKKNIEQNGSNQLAHHNGKPRRELYWQRIFYIVADSYCRANNLALSPEVNSGRGSVDFKIGSGYKDHVLVEIKLTSNTGLVSLYETQLATYQKAESSEKGKYVVIQVTEQETKIKRLIARRDDAIKNGKKVPDLILIDGRLRATGSKGGK